MKSSVSSPRTTARLHNDDVTLVHVKVDIYEDGIAFWPSTRKILRGDQGGHTLKKCGRRDADSQSLLPLVALTAFDSHASVRAPVNANRSYAFALV